jgi:hypothetical protein
LSTTGRDDVLSFLVAMKAILQSGGPGNENWTISTIRDKNIETITKLELDYEDIKDELMALTPLNYCEGPLKDTKITGDLWVFGKTIKSREVYIKLKIWGDSSCQQLRVLSFHIAEQKIKYCFKN